MKENKKSFFVMFIFFSIIFGVGAGALTNAINVSFNNSSSGMTSTNVQGAIEELNTKIKTKSGTVCTTPSEPNLNNNLIPVEISDNGTVTYADTSKKWYDYCNKKWANAVMLKSNPSKTYSKGNTILESDIKGYFVWIPKYKYKLWNVGTTNPTKGVHSIDIVFDNTNTTNVEGVSCVTPMTANNSGSCNNGEYMTHPAFISMNVNGFWVGKYELTGSIGNITVKPGLSSIRNQTVKTFFDSLYNYSRVNNSHMMKNTEWGAVAYLSHSKYGIDREVNINNNSRFITGMSALPSTDQHSFPNTNGNGSSYNSAYNTEIGYLASTTGNISGVYDMSGGSWEYMASYRSGAYNSSGFDSSTIGSYDSKYFDVYPRNSNMASWTYRILGDATGEMGPILSKIQEDNDPRYINKWYSDISYFVESSFSWFGRGGDYGQGVLAGQFFFDCYTGDIGEYHSTRLVLSP